MTTTLKERFKLKNPCLMICSGGIIIFYLAPIQLKLRTTLWRFSQMLHGPVGVVFAMVQVPMVSGTRRKENTTLIF